jgi:C-methyltransferase C-terminal domain/Methyltransferase domain/Putative zinc binding domain
MNYNLISRCRGCHTPDSIFQMVMKMERMPLAGMFCPAPTDAFSAPIFPLTWIQCNNCGLVQVLENIEDSLLFSDYNYASSTVAGLVLHFQEYATFLKSKYSNQDSLKLLEIGCNDGVLLNQLPSHWQLKGVDPSDVAFKASSNQSHYHLYNQPFSLNFVEDNGLENSIDVISGSNCLAHISDLKDVFEAAYLALRIGGHFWVEVHDLECLLEGCQWDTIYHEHKVEWSETSLLQCLLPLGFSHQETHKLPLHGGLLRVCFQKEELPQAVPIKESQIDAKLIQLRQAYEGRYQTKAAKILLAEINQGHPVAAYGAAGRANVYLNQLKEIRFDYIIDESPLRFGKFLPQVGTPVVERKTLTEKPVGNCLITAWNYRDDIIRKNPDFLGKWLTAFGEN